MTRDEARAAGVKRFTAGGKCIHGHAPDWYVRTGACVACLRRNQATTKKRKALGLAAVPKVTKDSSRAAFQAIMKSAQKNGIEKARVTRDQRREHDAGEAAAILSLSVPDFEARAEARIMAARVKS